jgi:hypothetical protein
MALSQDDVAAIAAEMLRQQRAAVGLIDLTHPDRGPETDAKNVVPGSPVERHYRKLGFVTYGELAERQKKEQEDREIAALEASAKATKGEPKRA